MSNSSSNINNTPSTVSYKPGGAISVAFGANDPDDNSPIQGSLPGNRGGGRVTVANGKTTSETFQHHTVNQSDVVADRVANAGDSILATARTPWGTLGRPLTPDSIVTIGGMDTSLAAAEQLGYVRRNGDRWEETGVTLASQENEAQQLQEDQQRQEQEDSFEFHPEHLAKIDELIEPIPQAIYDKSVASAITSGIQSLDFNELADTLGTNSADAQARAQFVASSYKNVADSAVSPIVGEDTQAMYDWAAEHHPELHQAAIRGLIFGNTTADLKALASVYMANTIPDAETLAAGNFETKSESGEDFVKIAGTWVTLSAAAKAGFI